MKKYYIEQRASMGKDGNRIYQIMRIDKDAIRCVSSHRKKSIAESRLRKIKK